MAATKNTKKKLAKKKVTKKKVAKKKAAGKVSTSKSRNPGSGKGRPKGSVTTEAVIVDVIKSRCPLCQSTSVAWSGSPMVRIAHGISPLTSQAYAAIRWTRKRCICGTTRVEKEYLDRAPVA